MIGDKVGCSASDINMKWNMVFRTLFCIATQNGIEHVCFGICGTGDCNYWNTAYTGNYEIITNGGLQKQGTVKGSQ